MSMRAGGLAGQRYIRAGAGRRTGTEVRRVRIDMRRGAYDSANSSRQHPRDAGPFAGDANADRFAEAVALRSGRFALPSPLELVPAGRGRILRNPPYSRRPATRAGPRPGT